MSEGTVALYLRLSDEEKDLDESNSITTQREILYDYIQRNHDLSKLQLTEFCDDGFTGTNFNRPGIKRMLEQVRLGSITCVLVKDFSRFGRNYIEVGNYLEQVFPFLGIRFISVNDQFDSSVTTRSGEFIDVAFKNLIHDLYSKDLSEKIISVRQSKAEQGKFITAYAPYGFLKSPDRQLVVDRETAPVVQQIFKMAAEGMPKSHIAKALNEDGILAPLMLRKQRGQHFPCKQVNEKSVWRASVISAMLKDQRYTGDAVYGKVKPAGVGSEKNRSVSREQWIVVPNCHEPVISHELFDTVNAMFLKRDNDSRHHTAPLSGMVRCEGCNHAISRRRRMKAGIGETASYRCQMFQITSEFGCYRGTIEEKQMEQAILLLLQKASAVFMSREVVETIEQNQNGKIEQVEKLLIKNISELYKINSIRLEKYKAYKKGTISKIEFIRIKEGLNRQAEQLSAASEQKREELHGLKISGASKPHLFQTLTRAITELFIEQINIGKDGTIKIEWKFKEFL